MKRITSRELALPISEKTGVCEADVRAVLLALDDLVGELVVAGERVEVSGLGTFHLKIREKTRKNIPGVGPRMIPTRYDVEFSPSKGLERRYAGLPPLTSEDGDVDPVSPEVGPEVIEVDNTGTLPILTQSLKDQMGIFKGSLSKFADEKPKKGK